MYKYTEKEIETLKEGGRRLAHILEMLGQNCVPGMKALDLDLLAEKMILENGDIPVFKNYKPRGAQYPFPASLCVSINDVVAHGIPKDQILQEGDVVSLDLGLRHNGLVVDSAISVVVGDHSKFPEEVRLLDVTRKALQIGIDNCKAGGNINDIGIAIEKFVTLSGFTVVDILCGHAVGREIHSEPIIPHIDMGEKGEKIKEGMVLAIEPHLSMGNGQISLSTKDSWSYTADDGAKSAQFEHTILVTKDGAIILTKK